MTASKVLCLVSFLLVTDCCRHKMAVPTVVFSRFSNVDKNKNKQQEQLETDPGQNRLEICADRIFLTDSPRTKNGKNGSRSCFRDFQKRQKRAEQQQNRA